MENNYVKMYNLDTSLSNKSVEEINDGIEYYIPHICDIVPYSDEKYEEKVVKMAFDCVIGEEMDLSIKTSTGDSYAQEDIITEAPYRIQIPSDEVLWKIFDIISKYTNIQIPNKDGFMWNSYISIIKDKW